MLRAITITFVCIISAFSLCSQPIGTDTILLNGSASKYINIVFLGDGYTDTLQDKYIEDAKKVTNYLFSQSPWSDYKNYFNVFAIKVVSEEAGTKHPNTAPDCSSANVPVSDPKTYFGVTFDYNNIHRLVAPKNLPLVVDVLSKNFPQYDQAIIIANSPYYGGSGGDFATTTLHTNSTDVAVHEIGHSFAKLADEYYAGDGYAYEKVNMTKNTDPATVKWKNWLGYNDIGIYQHCCGGNSAQWYKPSTKCKMQVLGKDFCNVCQEATIEKIHALVNPIVEYSPKEQNISSSEQFLKFSLDEVMKPISNTLQTTWILDNQAISNSPDSVIIDQNTLSNGKHELLVSVTDTNLLQRVNNHASVHFSTVTWTINKKTTGIDLQSALNKISWHISPNPASDFIRLEVNSDRAVQVEAKILTMDGKVVKNIVKTKLTGELNLVSDISALATGMYSVILQIDGAVFTEKLIKQ